MIKTLSKLGRESGSACRGASKEPRKVTSQAEEEDDAFALRSGMRPGRLRSTLPFSLVLEPRAGQVGKKNK